MSELTLGSFGVSVVLSILLRLLYGTMEISNRVKPWVAVLLGVLLGIVVMYYNLEPGSTVGFRLAVDNVLAGFMIGATSVGLYEMTKKS